jgi:hypothetical protein
MLRPANSFRDDNVSRVCRTDIVKRLKVRDSSWQRCSACICQLKGERSLLANFGPVGGELPRHLKYIARTWLAHAFLSSSLTTAMESVSIHPPTKDRLPARPAVSIRMIKPIQSIVDLLATA